MRVLRVVTYLILTLQEAGAIIRLFLLYYMYIIDIIYNIYILSECRIIVIIILTLEIRKLRHKYVK